MSWSALFTYGLRSREPYRRKDLTTRARLKVMSEARAANIHDEARTYHAELRNSTVRLQ